MCEEEPVHCVATFDSTYIQKRQCPSWRLIVTAASLLMVLLVITLYYYTDIGYMAKTYSLAKGVTFEHFGPHVASNIENFGDVNGKIKATRAHTARLLPHNSTRTDHKLISGGPIRDVALLNIRHLVGSDSENFAGERLNVQASLTRKTKLPPFDKYWSQILHFIPKADNQDCLNLFTTESSRSIAINSEWESVRAVAQMSEFRTILAPQHTKLTLLYQELARLEFVHTVCEIGFNVGQSAITWLTAKHDLKLYSFDIGGKLPEKMGQTLERLFPDRFQLTIGDSTKTVPLWIERGIKCDIVFIDGGHTYPIVHADILNMHKAAAKEHIIVLDDIYYPDVNKAWKEMVKQDVVHHLYDCWIKNQDIDFALGYYKHIYGQK